MVEQTHYSVARIDVTVPRSLKASEENMFFPSADIVWHGDPSGDRYAQVSSILQDGALLGTSGMKSGQAVDVDIEVTRVPRVDAKSAPYGGRLACDAFLADGAGCKVWRSDRRAAPGGCG